jgi:hypothetical protein
VPRTLRARWLGERSQQQSLLTPHVAPQRHAGDSSPSATPNDACAPSGWSNQLLSQKRRPSFGLGREGTSPQGAFDSLNPTLSAGRTALDAINVYRAVRTPRSQVLLADRRLGIGSANLLARPPSTPESAPATWPGCISLVSATDQLSTRTRESSLFPSMRLSPCRLRPAAHGKPMSAKTQRRIAVAGISSPGWLRR